MEKKDTQQKKKENCFRNNTEKKNTQTTDKKSLYSFIDRQTGQELISIHE